MAKETNVTEFILEKLAEGFVETGDLIAAILTAGYGASYKRLEYTKRKIAEERSHKPEPDKAKGVVKNIVSRLIKQGLVSRSDNRKLFLTKNGRHKLKAYKEGLTPRRFNNLEKSNNWIIVAFDIPEKERRKRDWLRSVLNNMGFQSIQKSFFVGQIKIPEELMSRLSALNLLDFIEIIEIGKRGSLERLTIN